MDTLHHNSIKALHAQHPSFGNCVRMLSCWCSGHFFSGYITHETLELIVASVYIEPDSEYSPTSPTAGFRRSLNRIATHDWFGQPIIVDFAGNISLSDRLLIVSKFQHAREQKDGPAMFIVTSTDREVGFEPSYSLSTPDNHILRLIVEAAKATTNLFADWIETNCTDDFTELMSSNVIPEKSNMTLKFSSMLFNSRILNAKGQLWWDGIRTGNPFARLKIFANLEQKDLAIKSLVVDSNSSAHPRQEDVVRQLRLAFSDVALFFWNSNNGNEIHVIWRPKAFLCCNFSILKTSYRLSIAGYVGRKESLGDGGKQEKESAITVNNSTEMIAKMFSLGNGAIVEFCIF